MSEEKVEEIKLHNEIYNKISEVSNILELPFNEVLNASLLYSYRRFWYPLQRYDSGLKVEDQPVKEHEYEPMLEELKEQIKLSHSIISEFEKSEEKFERRFPFGTFQDFEDRHWNLIEFIEESRIPKKKAVVTLTKKPITRELIEEIQEEEITPPEPSIQTKNFLKICIDYFTPQIHGVVDVINLVIFFFLAWITNFYLFWWLNSFWPIFDTGYFIRNFWWFVPFQIFGIPFAIFLISLVIWLIVMYPNRKKKKISKELIVKNRENSKQGSR